VKKCVKCDTSWSSGLPICPICDTKVEDDSNRGVTPARPSPGVSDPVPSIAKDGLSTPDSLNSSSIALLAVPRTERRLSLSAEAPAFLQPGTGGSQRVDAPRSPESVQAVTPPADSSPKASPEASVPVPALDLSILKGPIGLGVMAIASVFVLPLTLALVQHRVIGALGLCLSALFAPLAPIAWIAGDKAERRSRYLGLSVEAQNGEAGKLLGQWGTLVLVSEVAVVLFTISVLRLSGVFRLPFDLPE
jgi:hypothetical protein